MTDIVERRPFKAGDKVLCIDDRKQPVASFALQMAARSSARVVTGEIYLVKNIVNQDRDTPMMQLHGIPAWMVASRFRHVDDPAISWAWDMVKESGIDDAPRKPSKFDR